jgi:hypothetical protein
MMSGFSPDRRLWMDFETYFKNELDGLHQEGRYRVFADLERHRRAAFPRAIWRSNGGRSEGRHRLVLQRLSRHGPAP